MFGGDMSVILRKVDVVGIIPGSGDAGMTGADHKAFSRPPGFTALEKCSGVAEAENRNFILDSVTLPG